MADEQIVTSIVAKADLSSLVSEVHRVTASLQTLQRELLASNKSIAAATKVANNAFRDTLVQSGLYSSHFVNLHSDIDKFGKNLDAGRLKLKDYFNTFQQHTKTTKGLIRELAKEQVMLQNAILQPLGRNAQGLMQFNVAVPRGLDLVKNKTQLARMEMQIMNRALSEGASSLINWGKNTQWAGRQLTVGLTVPLTMFGTQAAKAFREADQELTRLTKVYGGLAATSASDLAQVRKDVAQTAKELSASMGVSFKDTIALAADIAATGKTGNELLGSLKETTRLAVLGEVDRQDAMKATLAIQSAFKQNTEELANSINFLNAVENQTSTTLNDLVEAIPKAGPIIKGLGGSVQDLALYLTAMREGGISASEGANALKSGLASLINPTKVAQDRFRSFGIDILGIVNKNAGDVTGTLLALQSALDTLNPLQKQQALEQLFGKFQFARMNALFENLGRQGSQTLQVLDLMKASTSDLANVASRELNMVTESASGKFRRAMESFKASLSGAGEQFLNFGTKLLNVLTKVMDFFNHLPGPIKKFLSLFGGLTAIAGPLIMITGVLANFFGYITKGIVLMRQFFMGQKGWKMLTPEMIAAQKAADMVEKSFYSDAQAAEVLHAALIKLVNDYNNLNGAMLKGGIPVPQNPAVTTTGGSPVIIPGTPAAMAQLRREVDPNNPFVGEANTRAISHINPRDKNNPATFLGGVPGAIPVNQKIGKNPQIYMTERLPNIEGLTSIGGVSTGIVAGEAARYHAMLATLGMQTEAEIAALKKTIALGGTISQDLLSSFDDILPITMRLSENAARDAAAIVSQLRAGNLTVDQARAEIIALNAQLERSMQAELATFAAARGRTIDFTKAPLMNQPVTDANAQFTLRDLYKKENNRAVMEEFGRLRGVRTFGAPYSIHTTRLPKFNTGGPIKSANKTYGDTSKIENFGPGKTTVSGSTSINYDDRLGNVPIGGYVLSQGPAMDPQNSGITDPSVVASTYTSGGSSNITAALTPGEIVYGPGIMKDPALYAAVHAANNGYNLGGQIIDRMRNYGTPAPVLSGDRASQLYDYLDYLTGEKYHDSFRQNSILNDATALLDSGKYSDINQAIDAAIRDVDNALKVADGDERRYYQARQIQAERRKLNTGVVGARQNVKAITRNLVAEELKLRGFSHIYDYADRAHLFPISYAETNRGYYGQAVHDPWNKYSNWLSDRLGIQDRVPLPGASAEFRANLIARQLGFEDHFDMLLRRAEFEKTIMSGRMMRGRTPTLALMRFLGRGKNEGGYIPGYNTGSGSSFIGMPTSYSRIAAARTIAERIAQEIGVSRFRKLPITETGHKVKELGGYSVGDLSKVTNGVYRKPDGRLVVYKAVESEAAALAEMRSAALMRGPHKLKTSQEQTIKVIADPTDPAGKRKILVIESAYDKNIANPTGEFTPTEGIRQLLAAAARGDKDVKTANVSGSYVADQGNAGVFGTASNRLTYGSPVTSAEEHLLMLLGAIKGGASGDLKRSLMKNAKELGFEKWSAEFRKELEDAILGYKETIPTFKLNSEEVGLYTNMQHRLESLRKADLETIYQALITDSKTKKKAVKKREKGGSVSQNEPYLVGEKGPELFVPSASGTIIPRYTAGGPITAFRNTYGERWNPETKQWEPKDGRPASSTPIVLDAEKGAGGIENRAQQMEQSRMAKSMNRMNAGFGMQIAGGMIGGNFGNALMIGGAVAQLSSVFDKAKAGGFLRTITSMSTMMAKLKNAFILASKYAKDFVKIVSQAFTKSNPIGWIVTAVVALTTYAFHMKKVREEQGKANRLRYGGTADQYATVGIKNYKSLTDRLKDYNAQLELNKAKVQSAFESYTKTGPTGITLTIKQLNDAVKNAKENQKDYVNSINTLQSSEVVSYVADLKAQFVALGMSSSEAANQIYAIVKASKYANQAFSAVTSDSFRAITDQSTAIQRLVKNLSANTGATFKAEQFDVGISALVNGALNYMNYLMTSKDTLNEIKNQYDALAKVLDEVAKVQGSSNTLTNDQLNELKKTNIMYANILGTVENTQSIMAKIILYQSGMAEIVNLAMMGANEAVTFAKNLKVVEDTINTVFEGDKGIEDANNPLAALAKQLKLRKDAAADAKKVIEDAKEFDKEAIQDQIDRQRDLIDAIEKERDARLKVLEVQEKSANFEVDIKSAQIKYQQFLAAGDMAQAAQAQLEIQKLSQNRQSDLAKQAINDKADRDRQKAEDEINRLQKIIDDQDKRLSVAEKNQTKQGDAAATLEDYINTIENIARNAITPEGKTRKLTDTEFKTIMNTIETMKKSKDSSIVDYAKSLETKYATSLDVQGNKVSTPTFSPQKYIDAVVNYLNQNGGAANEQFATAVQKFALAVDKFGGVPSQGFTQPGKGEYYANPFNIGYDHSFLKFSNKDGSRKIAIKTPSNKYEAVYRDAVAKGWRYEGAEPGTGFGGQNGPKNYEYFDASKNIPKLAMGGYVQHYGPGGGVNGPGTSTSDSIPAMLSDGEYVINAASAKAIGYDNLDSLNSIRRAAGGPVFKNGTLYAAQGTKATGAMSLKEKQDYLISLFMNRGLSYNGALGVVANLMAESGLNTGALNKKENSYGIAQWRLGRLDRLKKFAKDNGLNINSLQTQADFLWRELQERQYADLLGLLKYKDITSLKATELFMTIFERPKIGPAGATAKAAGRLALMNGYNLKSPSSQVVQPTPTTTTNPQKVTNPKIPTSNPFLAPDGKQEVNPYLNIYKISGISRLNALRLASGGFVRKYKGGSKGGVKSGYDASVDYFRALGDLAVNFETDKSFLAPDQINELKSIAEQIKKTGVKTLLVNGYADQRGSKAYNMALSMRRAKHVAALLEAFAPGIKFIPNAIGEQSSSYSKTAMSKKRKVAIELPYSTGMGLDKDPERYVGSGASMGGIGNGAYGLGPLLFHKGGPVGHTHSSGMSSFNPFAMGMEWFGNVLSNSAHNVSKFALGFDPGKPFNKQSGMEKLSMATMFIPGSSMATKGASFAPRAPKFLRSLFGTDNFYTNKSIVNFIDKLKGSDYVAPYELGRSSKRTLGSGAYGIYESDLHKLTFPSIFAGTSGQTIAHEFMHHVDAVKSHSSIKNLIKYLDDSGDKELAYLVSRTFLNAENKKPGTGYNAINQYLFNRLNTLPHVTPRWRGIMESYADSATYSLFDKFKSIDPKIAERIGNPYSNRGGYITSLRQFVAQASNNELIKSPEFFKGLIEGSPNASNEIKDSWKLYADLLKDVNPFTPLDSPLWKHITKLSKKGFAKGGYVGTKTPHHLGMHNQVPATTGTVFRKNNRFFQGLENALTFGFSSTGPALLAKSVVNKNKVNDGIRSIIRGGLHPFKEIAAGSATKGDWFNAALMAFPAVGKAGSGLFKLGSLLKTRKSKPVVDIVENVSNSIRKPPPPPPLPKTTKVNTQIPKVSLEKKPWTVDDFIDDIYKRGDNYVKSQDRKIQELINSSGLAKTLQRITDSYDKDLLKADNLLSSKDLLRYMDENKDVLDAVNTFAIKRKGDLSSFVEMLQQRLNPESLHAPGLDYVTHQLFNEGPAFERFLKMIEETQLDDMLKNVTSLNPSELLGNLKNILNNENWIEIVKKMGYSGGGKVIRKFHDWNGPIPGGYGKEVGAILQAGREGVYDTDYVNALRNGTINKSTTSSNVVNVGNVQMTFTQPVQNGRQVFEEFKSLMNFEKTKSTSSINLGIGA